MKKVIKLTESDLTRIVKRVINETMDSSKPSNGITLSGVNISVSQDNRGHLIFKSGQRTEQFKVTVDTLFYDGPVSVTKIYKDDDKIKIIDNTGKSFSIKSTNILNLIKQFNSNKSKLTASDMGATVNLTIA
jgi:alpha-tubulin suppressor-like RCC1 family protein